MVPEIVPVSRVMVDWKLLRKTVFDVTGLQPSSIIAQSPVKFTEVAEYLLFVAYLYLDITDEKPYNVLLSLPRECMEYVHYTFLIGCDRDVVEDLREKTRAHYTLTDVGKGYCVLGTGSLSIWYDAIILNLTHPRLALKASYGTRILFDKLMLFLEKEGLSQLFSNYIKMPLKDKTFMLEGK